MSEMLIAGRRIAPDAQPFMVAEMSGNHNGDIDRAMALINAAKAAGADAVKLQTYTADTITIDHDAPEFVIDDGGLWHGRTLYALYDQAHTPWHWHRPLFDHAAKIGITIFSAPFDPTAVDLLQELGAPAYKIASPEIVDIPLIEKVAATGKPMIMSTGMATETEIADALAAAQGAGCRDIVLLHCVSGYPTPIAESNLRRIRRIAERFDVLTGLSDHSIGITVPVTAAALGAVLIEKHFTLSRADGGVDSAFSLEKDELKALVDALKSSHLALGDGSPDRAASEKNSLRYRRSLYVVCDVAAGELLTPANIRSIRPSNGLPPKHLPQILGRVAARNLKRGEALSWDMVQ